MTEGGAERRDPASAAGPPAIRISTAERQAAIAILQEAVVDGRLTLEEYSDRVGVAVGARTDRDLQALTADLPRPLARGVPTSSSTVVEHRAVCSHIVRRGPLALDAESKYSSWFGTVDLDLRQATLPAADVSIDVKNVFGTVTVLVPEGVDVRMEGGGLMSSEHVDISNSAVVPGAPVIRVRVSGIGGTVYVRTHQPAGWLETLPGG
jgi:hypothetical protein